MQGTRVEVCLDNALARIFPEEAPAELKDFARYWLSRRNGRSMPRKADIDPIDIPWALPRIFMIARGPNGRFVYHLVGGETDRMLGGHTKGKTADQVFEASYARFTEERWERAARERLICFNGSFHVTVDNLPRLARRVLLPVSEDGAGVDFLLGLAHFQTPVADFAPPCADREAYNFLHWTPIDSLS